MAGLIVSTFPTVPWPVSVLEVCKCTVEAAADLSKITRYTPRGPKRPQLSLQNMPSHARWVWPYSGTQVAPSQERSIKK